MTNKILFIVIVLLICFPIKAQETTQTVENGQWGILFYSSFDLKEGLYWVPISGGEKKLLVNFDDLLEFDKNALGIQFWARLSPTEQKVAFSFLYGLDMGDGAIHNPESGDLYVFDLANRELQQITDRTGESNYPEYFVGNWNTTGTQLAYLSTGMDKEPSWLNIYNFETGTNQTVFDVNTIHDAYSPKLMSVIWSPDNETLAAVVAISNTQANESPYRIYLIDISNSTAHQILSQENIIGYSVSWSSDGEFLYYQCTSENALKICRINLDTLNTQLILSPDQVNPEWNNITYFDIAPDGKIVFSTGTVIISKQRKSDTVVDYLVVYDPLTQTYKNLLETETGVIVNPRWFYCLTCT